MLEPITEASCNLNSVETGKGIALSRCLFKVMTKLLQKIKVSDPIAHGLIGYIDGCGPGAHF